MNYYYIIRNKKMSTGVFWIYIDMLKYKATLDMRHNQLIYTYPDNDKPSEWSIESLLPENYLYKRYGIVK